MECVSALHHNKRKTNYHIHLIFSERTLLPEPEIKIATRSVFFDETGKRVRTKKEVTDEDGKIRKGCSIIKKGEVYESHLFTPKDDRFKSEPFLREVKQTEIHDKVSSSIRKSGWLPNLFRSIVSRAKEFLQNLIREHGMPPKPTLDIDMAEFQTMRNLMIRIQDEARGIRNLQDNILPNLRTQLSETTGIFKGKERKALTGQIQQTEAEISERLDKLPDILKEDGYPDVQAFMATYREAKAIVEQYKRSLAEWERQVKEKRRPQKPPAKESVRDRLGQLQEQGRQQPRRKKSFDRDSR